MQGTPEKMVKLQLQRDARLRRDRLEQEIGIQRAQRLALIRAPKKKGLFGWGGILGGRRKTRRKLRPRPRRSRR
jgi:hypothetical protein